MGGLTPGPGVDVQDLYREFVPSDKWNTGWGRQKSAAHQTTYKMIHTHELHTDGGREPATVFECA